jgi:hypothetical protein
MLPGIIERKQGCGHVPSSHTSTQPGHAGLRRIVKRLAAADRFDRELANANAV